MTDVGRTAGLGPVTRTPPPWPVKDLNYNRGLLNQWPTLLVEEGVARVEPRVSVRVRKLTRLQIFPERLHFFDPDRQDAIGCSWTYSTVRDGDASSQSSARHLASVAQYFESLLEALRASSSSNPGAMEALVPAMIWW